MRALVALLTVAVLAVTSACSGDADGTQPYSVQTAAVGESLAVLGWNIGVSNLRFDDDYVLFDVDASPTQADGPHAKPEDIRFGLYGSLAHPNRLAGTVCIGPMRDQSQVRGADVYSSKERIAGTAASYAAAYPVGVPPTNENDTGLVIKTSVDAFRGDGAQLDPAALGDPDAFTGRGYMLLGLEISGVAARYRDDSAQGAVR